MLSHSITRAWSRGNEQLLKQFAVQAGAEANLDESLPIGTNTLVAFALDVSQCVSLFLLSDVALTLKTNSSGSPVNTFTLAAGVPFCWVLGDPPLRDNAGAAVTTDITALYATNAAIAQLQIRCLFDPTV